MITTDEPRTSRLTVWPGLAVLLMIVVLTYWPVLRGGFIWDDATWTTNNPLNVDPQGIFKYWTAQHGADYWPLTGSAFWLQYQLWGSNASGYHLVNVLLHAGCAMLLWLVLRKLPMPGAWLAAAVFAVHPVNVTSVAWITELKNTLSMLLYLLTLLAWLRFDDKPKAIWYILAIVCFAMALLAKTSIVMLPLVLLGIAWWRRRTITWRDLLLTAPMFALSALAGAVTIFFQHTRAIVTDIHAPEGPLARAALAGKIVWFYLCKALWPSELTLIYKRWDAAAATFADFLPLIAAILAAAVIWWFAKRWTRPFAMGLGYFAVTLLPVMGLVNMSFMQHSFVSDHLQYVSIIGVIALVVGLLWRPFANLVIWRQAVAAVPLACVVLGLAFMTSQRAKTFASAEALWRDVTKKNPAAAVAWDSLAMSLVDNRHTRTEAAYCYDRAIALAPDKASTYVNRGGLYLSMNKGNEAMADFQRAVAIKPDLASAHGNIGLIYSAMGRQDEAMAAFNLAIELDPRHVASHNGRGKIHMDRGELDKALENLDKAVLYAPQVAQTHANRGGVHVARKDYPAAMRDFTRAIELDPKMASAYYNRGAAYQLSSKHQLAIDDFTIAIELQPNLIQAYLARAKSYSTLGRQDMTISDLQAALQLARRQDLPRLAATLTQWLRSMNAMPPNNTPATTESLIR